jgi:hypothetical protein
MTDPAENMPINEAAPSSTLEVAMALSRPQTMPDAVLVELRRCSNHPEEIHVISWLCALLHGEALRRALDPSHVLRQRKLPSA